MPQCTVSQTDRRTNDSIMSVQTQRLPGAQAAASASSRSIHGRAYISFLLAVQLNCCGVEGPQDYVHSSWFNHTRDLDGIFVPRSCCAPVSRRSVTMLVINENFCQVAAILYPVSLNESNFLFTQVMDHLLY